MQEKKRYYPNKQLKEQGSVNKKGKQGKWLSYNENGTVFLEVEYEDDEEHGQLIRYHDSGIVAYTSSFKHGKHDGRGVEYYENGMKKEEWNYKDGEYEPINFWNGQGEQLMKDGTGKKIEVFGIADSIVVEQHVENGKFIREVKLTHVVYGPFIPKESE